MNASASSDRNPLTETQAEQTRQLLERVRYEMKKVIVGQDALMERLLMAVMVHGHVLVEGAPGLAKTLMLKTLAQVLSLGFKRIQFTPDLLPSDVVGTRIYNPANGQFTTEPGPIFTHFVLADEINRAPAKVQSALLEAMQEGQVTLGHETFVLPKPFLVMATQNPLESEGTYPLPEAQLDRFLFKLLVDYPDSVAELAILQRVGEGGVAVAAPPVGIVSADALATIAQQVQQVYLDPAMMATIVQVVQATRGRVPLPGGLERFIHAGASPRGSLALASASKALALLQGRTYVLPEDLRAVLLDCLRHRVWISYQGLAAGHTVEALLESLWQEHGSIATTRSSVNA
ncbi:MAG: AAA family ATPase [Candidatus Melainabacteria bacterium]|nr:AAA family ATPase [Candidatus Melainabacteria bacterium]